MSISDKIHSIAQHLENAYAKISRKGGVIPSQKNMENLAEAIDSIDIGSPVVGAVKLNSPALNFGTRSSTNDPLIITNSYNGNFVDSYDIYDGETLLDSITANLTSNTINLRDYISSGRNHTIKVIAKGSSMLDSNPATISYNYYEYAEVTKTLSHCTITDGIVDYATIGSSYNATINPEAGYSFAGATVSVIMDEVDITSTAYDGKYGISINSVTGDIVINVTLAVMTRLDTPVISLNGDILTIEPIVGVDSFSLYVGGINYLSFENVTTIDLSEILVLTGEYIVSVSASGEGYYDSYESDLIMYEMVDGETPNAILENNSWEAISLTSFLGEAANYWAVGDTKTDLGTDGNTRTFRIADMQGLYNKHVVFEQVELENQSCEWSSNNSRYDISLVRTRYLKIFLGRYSDSLKAIITNTTYKVAYSSRSDADLIELTDKLFLPAEKEVVYSASYYYSLPIERNALTTYQYYAINTAKSYRQKFLLSSSSPNPWWLRSPSSYGGYVCYVGNDGDIGNYYGSVSYRVAACFSF